MKVEVGSCWWFANTEGREGLGLGQQRTRITMTGGRKKKTKTLMIIDLTVGTCALYIGTGTVRNAGNKEDSDSWDL